MNKIIDETNWISFLKEYSLEHAARRTRLGVFEQVNGIVDDYWIEDGLPLVAVDVYPNKGHMRIDILLENYAHPVEDVVRVIHYSDANEAGLDLVDESGRTTVLRFEDWK